MYSLSCISCISYPLLHNIPYLNMNINILYGFCYTATRNGTYHGNRDGFSLLRKKTQCECISPWRFRWSLLRFSASPRVSFLFKIEYTYISSQRLLFHLRSFASSLSSSSPFHACAHVQFFQKTNRKKLIRRRSPLSHASVPQRASVYYSTSL